MFCSELMVWNKAASTNSYLSLWRGPLKLGAKWRKLAFIFLGISISFVIQLVRLWVDRRRIEDERITFLSSLSLQLGLRMPGFRWGAGKSGVVSALGWVFGSQVPSTQAQTGRCCVALVPSISCWLLEGSCNFGDSQACSVGVLITGPRTSASGTLIEESSGD